MASFYSLSAVIYLVNEAAAASSSVMIPPSGGETHGPNGLNPGAVRWPLRAIVAAWCIRWVVIVVVLCWPHLAVVHQLSVHDQIIVGGRQLHSFRCDHRRLSMGGSRWASMVMGAMVATVGMSVVVVGG